MILGEKERKAATAKNKRAEEEVNMNNMSGRGEGETKRECDAW